MKYFSDHEKLKSVRCVPSASRPSPGKLGYYNGGYIVKKHAKMNRVDSLQIELPMSVRCQPGPVREAAISALTRGIKEFHDLHYSDRQVTENCSSKKNSCLSFDIWIIFLTQYSQIFPWKWTSLTLRMNQSQQQNPPPYHLSLLLPRLLHLLLNFLPKPLPAK